MHLFDRMLGSASRTKLSRRRRTASMPEPTSLCFVLAVVNSTNVEDHTITCLHTRQASLNAIADVPDRDRIVVAARDVEELILKSCKSRCQYSSVVCFESRHQLVLAVVFLLMLRRGIASLIRPTHVNSAANPGTKQITSTK